jgi:hypothetical protein
MRLLLASLIVTATFVVGAAVAPAAGASRAVHLQNAVDISNSFTIPAGELCSFDVTITISGALDVTLIYNDAGLVIREIDTTPAAIATYSSANGSFNIPQAITGIFTYPGGATVGSTVNWTASGLFGHVPGFIASDAGIDIISNGVVVGFLPGGVPLDAFTDQTTVVSHGNRESSDDIVAAICAALS